MDLSFMLGLLTASKTLFNIYKKILLQRAVINIENCKKNNNIITIFNSKKGKMLSPDITIYL